MGHFEKTFQKYIEVEVPQHLIRSQELLDKSSKTLEKSEWLLRNTQQTLNASDKLLKQLRAFKQADEEQD
jgi:hypothetical protein